MQFYSGRLRMLSSRPNMAKFDWFISKSKSDSKPYQFDGVSWMVENETRSDPPMGCRGGFLADEMGLGKTIMMIGTFITNLVPRTLVVLPSVLVAQWHAEIFRTTGHKALVYHGPEKKSIDLEKLNKSLIVLTTYNSIAIGKNGVGLLHQVAWDRLVFDEAHHLRNKNSRWLGAKALQSPIRWLISGTPIQNKRQDFYNMCSALGLPASYYASKDNIRSIVENFVLRRTKKEVGISVPDMQSCRRAVVWSNKHEQKLSEDVHLALRFSPAKLLLLMRARQMCIYPAMLKNSVNSMVSDSLLPRDNDYISATASSSKMDAVAETLLERAGNGNGKLVFCHFRQEIDILLERLHADGLHNVEFFDGRTGQAKRIRTLAGKFEVLVLQIQTGCEGLNLQKDFSEVYFVSPDWNPAVEEQAVARCHRIGQTKEVQVFRFEMGGFQKKNLDTELDLELDLEEDSCTDNLDQYINKTQNKKNIIRSEFLKLE